MIYFIEKYDLRSKATSMTIKETVVPHFTLAAKL